MELTKAQALSEGLLDFADEVMSMRDHFLFDDHNDDSARMLLEVRDELVISAKVLSRVASQHESEPIADVEMGVRDAIKPLVDDSHQVTPMGDAAPAMTNGHKPSIGEFVVRTREAKGLSLDDLAERADLGVTTLQRLESNETRYPRESTLRRLSTALGVPYKELQAIADV